MSLFPMTTQTQWQVSAMHMTANATLTAQGQLQAEIDTWSTWKFKGFTGACVVSVMDANSNYLFDWIIWPLGVDGQWTPKRSRRHDSRRTYLPGDVVSAADHLRVRCEHAPRDRFFEIVDEAREKGKYLVDGAMDLAGAIV